MRRPPRRCPMCKEKDGWIRIQKDRVGFSIGRAALGYMIGGAPGGLIFGATGQKAALYGCRRCGFTSYYKR